MHIPLPAPQPLQIGLAAMHIRDLAASVQSSAIKTDTSNKQTEKEIFI